MAVCPSAALQCRQSRVGVAGPSGCSVTAVESGLAFQLTLDGALDFATPQAYVSQLTIAQRFELKDYAALHAPIQVGHPPGLHPGDQSAELGCDAL